MRQKNKKRLRGFSLIEVLIVLAILVLILLIAFHFYQKYLGQANDGKRKSDLQELTVVLEDFYNDHGCYPRPTQICYDAETDEDNPCHICGEEGNPIPQYKLPCNPNHPAERYLYEVDDSTCPKWYRIFSKLSLPDNSGPCPYSLCGPVESLEGYDYGVSSSNVGLEIGTSLYGRSPEFQCQSCGTLDNCERVYLRGTINAIYRSKDACCYQEPDATNCIWNGWDGSDCTTCRGSLNSCASQGLVIYFDSEEYTWHELCCADHSDVAPSCQ